MNSNIWKIIEVLIVFIIGDFFMSPIVVQWTSQLFPTPNSNILATPEVVFLINFVLPGGIADVIWITLKSKLPSKTKK